MPFYLGVGTGATDRLDLMDESSYLILPTGFRIDNDATSRDHQILTLPLHLRGTDHNALLDSRRAILAKLHQATLGNSPVQEWVTLAIQLSGADTMVWWHVVSGTIPEPGALRPYGNYIGVESEPLMLSLRCRKGALGSPIVDDPVVITGSDPTLFREGVPGDMPALVEMVLTDQSTGGTIVHGFSVGSRSMAEMLEGDFEPFQSVTEAGIGSLDDTDTDRFGDDYVVATPGTNFQTMAEVVPSAALLRGEFDLLLRVRDDATTLEAPQGLMASAVTGGSPRQVAVEHGDADDGDATEISVTIGQTTVPGNSLQLAVAFRDQGATTATVDTVPAGFTLTESGVDDGAEYRVALYTYPNAPAHSGDLTVTFTNVRFAVAIMFFEWNGFTSSPVDVTADNGDSGTTHDTGTTLATTQANAVALALHYLEDFVRVEDYTSGWKSLANVSVDHGFSSGRLFAYYNVLTATGTQTATLTTEANADNSANLIAVFKTSAGGALTTDLFGYRVVALDADGNQSPASSPISIFHSSASGNGTQLEWQPSTSPGVVGYRVYAKKGNDSWVYFDTGSTNPTFLHSTMTGPTGTQDPPDTGLEPSELRIGLALGSNGVITHYTDPVRPRIANGVWEWLRVSSESLSPMAVPLSVAQPTYRLVIQNRHRSGSGDVAVDVVAFAPRDEAWFEADVRGAELDSVREWIVGTNQGGHAYAFIRDPVNSADVSGAHGSGQLMLGPGDTKTMLLFTGAGGAAIVEGVAGEVVRTIYPRYRYLAGSI